MVRSYGGRNQLRLCKCLYSHLQLHYPHVRQNYLQQQDYLSSLSPLSGVSPVWLPGRFAVSTGVCFGILAPFAEPPAQSVVGMWTNSPCRGLSHRFPETKLDEVSFDLALYYCHHLMTWHLLWMARETYPADPHE